MNYKNIINLIGFYICWWLSIFGAVQGKYFLGPISLLMYIIIHFSIINHHKKEYIYLIFCLFLGFLVDTILLKINFIVYSGYLSENYRIAPLWVVTLWISFGLSIFHSFQLLQKNYKSTMLLGTLSGPVIYYSCMKAKIISFEFSLVISLICISIIWSVILPLYVYIADMLIGE